MVAAYECLDDETREQIDGLTAVHDFVLSFGLLLTPEQREEKRKEYPPAIHPVVRTHPDTGERAVYVNPVFTSHIEGLPREESLQIIDELCAQAEIPEYHCRFHWDENTAWRSGTTASCSTTR